MKAPTLERTSAAKAGWVIIGLILAWLAFLFVPLPQEDKPAAAEIPTSPPSSLQKAGLRDYTDWEGLPEIFAVWADKAEWKDGKTRFAYWHPVMKNYSYFFEATRVDGGYRFKEIPEPKDPSGYWDEKLAEDCPIRFYHFYLLEAPPLAPSVSSDPPGPPPVKRLKLDVTAPQITLPKAEVISAKPSSKS